MRMTAPLWLDLFGWNSGLNDHGIKSGWRWEKLKIDYTSVCVRVCEQMFKHVCALFPCEFTFKQ
jgi:hypothetical protein